MRAVERLAEHAERDLRRAVAPARPDRRAAAGARARARSAAAPDRGCSRRAARARASTCARATRRAMPKLLRPATPPSAPPRRSIAVRDRGGVELAAAARDQAREQRGRAGASSHPRRAGRRATPRASRRPAPTDRGARAAPCRSAARRASRPAPRPRAACAVSERRTALLGLARERRARCARALPSGSIAATLALSGAQVAPHHVGDVVATHRADPIEVDVTELRIAGDRRVPAERASAALRGLELAHERGLGGDPRLVELVGGQLVDERERCDRRARRPTAARVAGARGRRQHEQARDRAARGRSRTRWSRADRDRAAAAAAARTRSGRAGSRRHRAPRDRGGAPPGRGSRPTRYASLTSRMRARRARRGLHRARRHAARAGRPGGHRAEPALDAAPHARPDRHRRRRRASGCRRRSSCGRTRRAARSPRRAHAVGGADHRAAVRVRDERGREQALRDRARRIVGALPDLLEDDLALAGELVGIDARRQSARRRAHRSRAST